MSEKLYMGKYTADEYIEYLRKEVKICNEFHKNIIRVQDKKIAKLMECVDYLWENEPDKTEMLDVIQETLKELEGDIVTNSTQS